MDWVVQFNSVLAGVLIVTVAGVASTLIKILAVALHPFTSTPVTVYVVVASGLSSTPARLLNDNPVVGIQL